METQKIGQANRIHLIDANGKVELASVLVGTVLLCPGCLTPGNTLRDQRGQRHFQFFANFFGRLQQRGSFFNQKNIGNVSAPFGLMFYLIVVRVAEADSICKVTSVAGGVAGQKIVVCPFFARLLVCRLLIL
jgi:hypothetical protein